jgi:hypothetical protein
MTQIIHANPDKPLSAAMPAPTAATFGAAPVSMASRVGGAMHNYLGHFAQPKNLMAGHNRCKGGQFNVSDSGA